jgi:hypothetical protein
MQTTTPSPHLPAAARSEDEARRRGLRAQARAMPEEAAFICDTLRLARLCRRTACRKVDRCRGHPRMCLDTTGEAVPFDAFDFAVQLAQARRDGEPADHAATTYPQEAAAHACWVAGLDARVRRNR